MGGKVQVALSPDAAGTGAGAGVLASTVQSAGAVTCTLKTALRSGCSKFAKTRRASEGSQFVYVYTFPSAESVYRPRPPPSVPYAQDALTRSSFSASRPASAIRPSRWTCAGSSARPFNVISCTVSATRSA